MGMEKCEVCSTGTTFVMLILIVSDVIGEVNLHVSGDVYGSFQFRP